MSSETPARAKSGTARSNARLPMWNVSRILRSQSDANAGDFLRAWQPDERDREQQIHAGMARDWRSDAAAEGHPVDLGALVLAADSRHSDGASANDSRLWRVFSAAFRNAIPAGPPPRAPDPPSVTRHA